MKRLLYLTFLFPFLAGCNPTVAILSPVNCDMFNPGEPITFVGSATGLNNGSEDSLVWTSSIDGEIGTGGSFTIDDLLEDIHTIKLTAINSQGQTLTDSIVITIEDRANMVLISAGEFEMGCQDDECADDEIPDHDVSLDGFYIDKYEVTNLRYAAFLNSQGNDCYSYKCYSEEESYSRINQAGETWAVAPGYEEHPATYVTWYGAGAYCEYLGKRLPTEAEWEKASRGGLEEKKYPWGDTEADCTYANFHGCLDNTVAVGSYSPNDYGLYDMSGNVWEWASDWYDFSYYETSPYSNPTGSNSGPFFFKVLRGGSWKSNSEHLRSANRDRYCPDFHYWVGVGFRCVKGTQ